MKVRVNTGDAEPLVLELGCVPSVGHYIHHKQRVFVVESVVHEEGRETYLSVAEIMI